MLDILMDEGSGYKMRRSVLKFVIFLSIEQYLFGTSEK